MKNGDKPAFLEKIIEHPRGGNEKSFGLTKREYFAAMAMQGLCANPFYAQQEHERGTKAAGDYVMDSPLTMRAIEIADELLKQLGE